MAGPPIMLSAGKVLLTDGKVAADPACCCNGGNLCAITTACESATVVKDKCGLFPIFDGSLWWTDMVWNEADGRFDFSGPSTVNKRYKAISGVFSSYHWTGGSLLHPGSGSISVSQSIGTDCVEDSYECSGTIYDDDGAPNKTCADVDHTSRQLDPLIDGEGVGGAARDERHLSSEYTTDELLSIVAAAISAATYSGFSCAAFKGLSSDETTATMTRLRMTITPTPLAAYVEWDVVFTPTDGSSPTSTHHAGADPGVQVIEIVPTSDDPDGTWTVANIICLS